MMNLEQQRAHYRAVRARIAAAAPAPRATLSPPPPPPRTPQAPLNDLASLPVSPRTRESLRHVLAAHRAIWRDVIGPARDGRLIHLRRSVCWLLHCNGFSLSHIGTLTHRDPTSISNALRKVNSWTQKQF